MAFSKNLKTLEFEVVESPVLYQPYEGNNNIVASPKYKVLSRSDNGKELSVMRNTYTPMFNEHFVETTERMAQISGFEINQYSEFKGGAIVFSHLKNNLEDIKIAGSPIKDYLMLGNSFNGKFSFFVGTTTILIRCTNAFSHISQLEKIRHTASAPKKLEELMRRLEIYFDERKKMYENFTRMSEYEIDLQVKQDAIAYILQIEKQDMLDGELSKAKMNQAELLSLAMNEEISGLGRNMWGIFNGVTRYSTHIMKSNEEQFGNAFGQKSVINKRAMQFALNEMQLS